MAWYWVVLACIASGVIGLIFGARFWRHRPDGKLTIDLYGESQPISLHLYRDIYELMERNGTGIILQVDASKMMGYGSGQKVTMEEVKSEEQ